MPKNAKALKRKQQKQAKRKQKIKRSKSTKITSIPGYSKIKAASHKLPNLIFEPEFGDIDIQKEELLAAISKHQNLPDQIDAFFNDNNQVVKLMEAVRKISNRPASPLVKLQVQSLLKLAENDLPPLSQFPLTVAWFLQLQQKLTDQGPTINADNLLGVIDDYEKQWSDYFNQHQALASNQEIEASTSLDLDDDLSSDISLTGESFPTLNDNNQKLLKKVIGDFAGKFDPIELEDDLQIFINEYLIEKSVYQPQDIKPSFFNDFLIVWFPDNMNPLAEDILKMKKHLAALNISLQKYGFISDESFAQITELLSTE